MIARRRFLAFFGLPLALAGCGGWEPLYADHETASASADLRAIKVAPIPERIGQRLEMALRKSFNPEDEASPVKYVLTVTPSVSVSDLGIQSQGLGTRGQVQVVVNYVLHDASSHTLQAGFIRAEDSFDIQANGYSTVVAQDDAYVRIVEEIRRELTIRMVLYMQKKAIAAS
jgi:LPS-assembly lipoprotein